MCSLRYAFSLSSALLLVSGFGQAFAMEPKTWRVDSQLRTVAEQSGYRATAPSAFVVEFVKTVASKVDHINYFEFGRTIEDRPMTAASVGWPPLSLTGALPADGRLTVLINANIHSGECCGKEAMLRMLRELVHEPAHEWLQRLNLIVIPNYNADGNDKVAKDNRRGQVGPVEGMGTRANAQQLDLNRDYVKLESPEARSLVGLMNRFRPHCFIDLHTTNGSWHRYQLTYDIVHNPAADALLNDLMRRKMMPVVTAALRIPGVDTFYYGNFNDDHTRWTTTDHRPRFGLDYVSLRGRISILSEAYSYIPFQKRIEATHAFVTECLNYLSRHAESVNRTLAAVEKNTIHQGAKSDPEDSVAIRARVAPFSAKVTVKGFDPPRRPRIRPDEVSAGVAPQPPGSPQDYLVDYYGRFEPAHRVTRPFAYIVPAKLRPVIRQLQLHGITLEQLSKPVELKVEVYRCERVERAKQVFQQHRLVAVDASRRSESRSFEQGTFIVRTSQPLGNLLIYLLELESDDGLVTWNLFDDYLAEGEDFPIVRLMKPATLPILPDGRPESKPQ